MSRSFLFALFGFGLLTVTSAGGPSFDIVRSSEGVSSINSEISESSVAPSSEESQASSSESSSQSESSFSYAPSQTQCTTCAGLFTYPPSDCSCDTRDRYTKYKLVYDDVKKNDPETCCMSLAVNVEDKDKFDKTGWIPKDTPGYKEQVKGAIGTFRVY